MSDERTSITSVRNGSSLEDSASPAAPARSERRPPGPPDSPTNLIAARRNPLRFIQHAASFGDLTHFRLGPKDLYLVTHPDYVQDIIITNHRRYHPPGAFPLLGNGLLTSVGDYHKRQRRLVQPAFHHQRIAQYAEIMGALAGRAASHWKDGQELDIRHVMTDLTLAIVMKTLFDTDIELNNMADLRHAMETISVVNGQGGGAWGSVNRAAALESQEFKQALATFDAFIHRIIADRHNRRSEHDVVSMLMDARDDDGSGMTDEQLRDEAVALVGAGHETLANGLTWAFFLLGQHPDVQARLRAEVDEVVGDRLVGWEDLTALPYSKRVVSESMRLYPPVPISGRRCVEDHELDGYLITAGSKVMLGQYVVHRDPRWWPDPERFDPDRWTEGAERDRPKFSYFPFGGGSRLCIGESFAWMEARIILATIVKSWNVRLVSDPNVSALPWVTLRPASPIRLQVSARH